MISEGAASGRTLGERRPPSTSRPRIAPPIIATASPTVRASTARLRDVGQDGAAVYEHKGGVVFACGAVSFVQQLAVGQTLPTHVLDRIGVVVREQMQYSLSVTAVIGWLGSMVRLGRLGLRVLAVLLTLPAHWGQMIFLGPFLKCWRTLHWYLARSSYHCWRSVPVRSSGWVCRGGGVHSARMVPQWTRRGVLRLPAVMILGRWQTSWVALETVSDFAPAPV